MVLQLIWWLFLPSWLLIIFNIILLNILLFNGRNAITYKLFIFIFCFFLICLILIGIVISFNILFLQLTCSNILRAFFFVIFLVCVRLKVGCYWERSVFIWRFRCLFGLIFFMRIVFRRSFIFFDCSGGLALLCSWRGSSFGTLLVSLLLFVWYNTIFFWRGLCLDIFIIIRSKRVGNFIWIFLRLLLVWWIFVLLWFHLFFLTV